MAAEGVEAAVRKGSDDSALERKRKADVLDGDAAIENGHANGAPANGHWNGTGSSGELHEANGSGPARTEVEVEEETLHVKQVQKKWQMCSCVHFFAIFKGVIPLQAVAPATAGALEPLLLERAVGDPASSSGLSVVYRDVVVSLLAALKELPAKSTAAIEKWFSVLSKLVTARPQDFPDCYDGVLGAPGTNVLERFDGDGMSFIYGAGWQCRLGLLHSLCDIVAEEAECVREVVKESERLSSASRQEIEARHYRLVPLGRCSKRRFYFCIGGQRIYSGLKRKGSGAMVVECSDVSSMRRMVDALEESQDSKDAALGSKIRSWYLGPLIEAEERKRRKVDRDLAAEAQREESRRRNAERPRRAGASYI